MKTRWFARLTFAIVIALGAALPHARLAARAGQNPPPPGSAAGIAPEALAQIEALLREKGQRSTVDRKIDSQLLYELRMSAGQPVALGVPVLQTDIPYAQDGHLVIDVKADVTEALLATLADRGIEVIVRETAMLRLHVEIDQVPALAALPDVSFVQPRQGARTSRWNGAGAASRTSRRQTIVRSVSQALNQSAKPNVLFTQTGQGSRSSEGDIAHLAFAARTAFGANGAGVKIGVLSDGVAHLAASQAAGDLGPVTVLPGQTGTGDEGTAMLEIIHDLAPDAQLFFATAFGNIQSFADNIRALRQAGCDIIVDDVFYFVETPFQDGQTSLVGNTFGGVVTQAVNEVTADGALYFSSAGNGGNLNAGSSSTWEGDFADAGPTSAPVPAGRLHSFGSQTFNVFTFNGGVMNLYWSDPLGGSSNDYDLFRLNSTGTAVTGSSTNPQSGTQDPYEQVNGGFDGERIVIVKAAGAADRFLHLSAIEGRLQIGTEGEIHGHAAAAAAFAVAATPALAAFPQPFSASNSVEYFSSDGPRRLFYQADGTAFTPGNFTATGGTLRQEPDITAADGVSVTGVGGFQSPFYGTSAAAPHAAAIAALLKSANGALTPAEIRALLIASAIDIGPPGTDRDSGAGIVMADALMRAAGVPGTAHVEVSNVFSSDAPGNGNGSPEAGEGAFLVAELANYGGAAATAVSATLTTSTTGVSIMQPAVRGYPDLPISASALHDSVFSFTLASNFLCGQPAAFTLTVSYSGGPSPRVFNFQVPTGPPVYSMTTTLDATAPPGSPGVTTSAGTQSRRLNRDGVVASCGITKATPLLAAGTSARQYEAYAFNTCANSPPTCVTVTLESANTDLFSAAYSPSFVPTNVRQNYRADPGGSASLVSYSFNLAGGAQTFVVDVHEVDAGIGVGDQYTLSVAGACGGSCAPPNQVPIAVAANVTVTADPLTLTAFASVDNGSSDPDGGLPILTQSPPGPYPIGETSVILTASDAMGASSQATATVTVLGPTAISISDASVTEGDAGPVSAQFTVTLSKTSAAIVEVSYATADQTATAPGDYLSDANILSFAPGELSKVINITVNGDTVYEPDETFLVNLVAPIGAIIADPQGVGTIQDDEPLSEAAVTQAVATGSARVQALQRADGGWFFKVGDTDCGAGAGVSCPNIAGMTGLGLLAGYLRTDEPSLLTSATAAGNFLVARYNAAILQVPQGLPFAQDIEFLIELAQLTGNPLYTSTAQSWFQILVNQFPVAADRVDLLLARRGLFRTVGAWDTASLIRSAKAVGNIAYAEAAADRIRDLEPQWKDTNPLHRFDQCEGVGCGPPDNPFAYDYTLIAMGSLLWAFHDLPGFGAEVADYRAHLLAQQDPAGSWDVGDSQITAYVVLGLAAVGGAGAGEAIDGALEFFLSQQLATGGWPSYVTFGQLGAEYTEIDAEVVRAMFTLYNTPIGPEVMVEPAQLSTVTFSQVLTSGFTSVVATDRPAGTTVAPGFTILHDLNYEVLTTASTHGRTVVCFSVPWVTDAATFANVRILHDEGGVLVDRTILAPRRRAPDFASRRVCARVSSLSAFAIALRDTTPPAMTVTLTPSVLGPPDHRMVTITAAIDVTDDTDPAPRVKLRSITSSERDHGLGRGDKPDDIRHARMGTDDRTFELRAERFSRAGRVYTVVYRVIDRSGNKRDVTATVVVPPH